MNPETKALVISNMRECLDVWEAETDQAYPDFENAVAIVVDNPDTVWDNGKLSSEWSISVYGSTYKDMREVVKAMAKDRGWEVTTSFIEADTISITFINI